MTKTDDVTKTIANKLPENDRDLGFGSIVAGESRQRFLNQDGSFNVRRMGLPFITSLNFYHILLTISWTTFIALTLVMYFLSNVVFGLFYTTLGSDALVDSSNEPFVNLFVRAFFFSVQTFATIGYGTIHPVGVAANLIVTLESYYSMIVTALITGIVFARFARPTAKIIFSSKAVIAPYQAGKGLMFRIVNGRSNQLIELQAQVFLARFVEENGKIERRFDPLELERKRVTFFPLAWTVVHPIDENSPLSGLTLDDLRKGDAELLILLSGTDETFAQIVHTRTSYKADEIIYGYKFTTIYKERRDGEPISIDIRKLSRIEKAEIAG